jgi:hypothetical protein
MVYLEALDDLDRILEWHKAGTNGCILNNTSFEPTTWVEFIPLNKQLRIDLS